MDRGRQIAALKVRGFEGRITVAPALHISLGLVCGYTRGGIAGSVQARQTRYKEAGWRTWSESVCRKRGGR